MNILVAAQAHRVIVRMADMKASKKIEEELVTYSLGSCLGIAIYDPMARVGGLLHVLLPDSSLDPEKAAKLPYLFVNTGLPLLFRAVYELGGEKPRIQVKVAGGADMIMGKNIFNVGERNFVALQDLLHHNGVKIKSSAVGGHISRTLRLNLATGDVWVETPGRENICL